MVRLIFNVFGLLLFLVALYLSITLRGNQKDPATSILEPSIIIEEELPPIRAENE